MRGVIATVCIGALVVLALCLFSVSTPVNPYRRANLTATAQYGSQQWHIQLTAMATGGSK